MIELVRASPAHVGVIANRMRVADVEEARAFGHTPKQALRLGLMASDEAWTAKLNGRPEAMFGLVTVSALDGLARPWFLGTEAVYDNGRAMLRMGLGITGRWLDSNRRLENLVSASNSRAIRLLGRWGFTIEDDTMIVGGVPFHKFWAGANV